MTFSPALRWFVAIVLPLTLAWKLIVTADSNDRLESDVTAFLTLQGFQVAVSDEGFFHRLLAVRGSCRMAVTVASNDGTERDMLRSLASADEDLIFIHRGKVYQEQPTLAAVSAELSARALRKLGLTDRREFVLAVAAQRQCDAACLPWHEIRNRGAGGQSCQRRVTEADQPAASRFRYGMQAAGDKSPNSRD